MGKKSKTGKLVFNISDEEYNSVIISCGKQGIIDNKKVKLYSEKLNLKNNKDVTLNEQFEESNVVGHLLNYKGNNIGIFIDSSGQTWWKAINVTQIMEYVNSEQTIRKNVSKLNKSKFGDLIITE